MTSLISRTTVTTRRRSIPELLQPLEVMARRSVSLISNHPARFEINGDACELPRYLYIGPKGGDDPIRIGLFSLLEGDEHEGAAALIDLVRILETNAELARGYCLFLYPVCNPTGFEDNTRCSRRGRDLNREFWNHSREPEVELLQSELITHALDGIITLHSDPEADGVYAFVRGATLARHLVEPALASVRSILPRHSGGMIEGFKAEHGIIRNGFAGAISGAPGITPRPFDIVLKTPRKAPQALQRQALVTAVLTLLQEYRKLIAYAANL